MIFSGGEGGPQSNHQRHWIIWLTFVVSLIIDSITWPHAWGIAIPDITPLVLFYWVLAISQKSFVVTATLLGMIHDILYLSSLGTHAIVYLILLYPLLHIRLQLRNMTLFQMSIVMGFFVLIHQVLLWLFHWGKLSAEQQLPYLLASLVAIFIWPLLFISLRSLRRNMRIR